MSAKSLFRWEKYSDEKLLKMRFKDLKLKISRPELHKAILQLQDELEEKKLPLKPKIYLGDEWFSPEGEVAIALPFYLAHPRLMKLENQMMFEVEGENHHECMKLLRHEAGHCFDHAWKFSRRKKWKSIFGSPEKEYAPDRYRPKPYSRSYVRHIKNWYAQSHPDEDFAETFAVWLNPESSWQKKYKNWPQALKKLNYIEALAKESQKKKPPTPPSYLPFSVKRMATTLEKHYRTRAKEHGQDYPHFFDRDLKRIFSGDQEASKRGASCRAFLKKNRKTVVDCVHRWSREKKYTVNRLYKRLEKRCLELDLRVGDSSNEELCIDMSCYMATLINTYLFTGKFKRSI